MHDRETVRLRLEEAGMTLLALPGGGRASRIGSSMPAVTRQAIDAYGWTDERIRPAHPTPAEISRMDEALPWISLIRADNPKPGAAELHSLDGGVQLRNIVGARMLIDPITRRYLFSWSRLGKAMGADRKAITRWHEAAMALIATRLNELEQKGRAA